VDGAEVGWRQRMFLPKSLRSSCGWGRGGLETKDVPPKEFNSPKEGTRRNGFSSSSQAEIVPPKYCEHRA